MKNVASVVNQMPISIIPDGWLFLCSPMIIIIIIIIMVIHRVDQGRDASSSIMIIIIDHRFRFSISGLSWSSSIDRFGSISRGIGPPCWHHHRHRHRSVPFGIGISQKAHAHTLGTIGFGFGSVSVRWGEKRRWATHTH